MKDIVQVLEEFAKELGFTFSYGNKANQNLLTSDLVDDRIYMVLDPVRRLFASSEFGGDGNVTYTSKFFLVVKSTIDQTYHFQTEGGIFATRMERLGGTTYVNDCFGGATLGKYTENILPLLTTAMVDLKDLIDCSDDYEITNWEVIDAINVMDINMDGIIITFTIKKT